MLSENLTAKQLSAVSRVNKVLSSIVKDYVQFSLIDIDSQSGSIFFTCYVNEQGQKKLFACGDNRSGQLG